MTNNRLKQNELRESIERVLWEEWDPIGLNECNGPKDEYSGYVPSIFKLLTENGDMQIIAETLHHRANVNMGLSTELEEHLPIAQKLFEISKGY